MLPLPYKAALPVAVLLILAVLIAFGWYEGPRLLAQLRGLSEQLPPALLLFSIFLMGTLFGFVGMLIAAPLVAVLLVLVKMLYVQDTLGDETELPGSS